MSNIYRTNYDVVFNGTTSDDVIYAYAWSDFVYADRRKGYLHTTVTTILGIALMIWGAYGNAAGAVELFTAPLSIQTTNPDAPLRGLRCHFVNVSHSPRGGTIEIIHLDGMALSTTSYNESHPAEERVIAYLFCPLSGPRLPPHTAKLPSIRFLTKNRI